MPDATSPNNLNCFAYIKRLKRDPAESKADAGKVVLIGGAPGMAGAIVLAGKACLHLGAGWTVLEMLDAASAHLVPEQAELMVRFAKPDAAIELAELKPDCIAIGPGLGNSSAAMDWLTAVLAYPAIPLIIDADALNLISQNETLLQHLRNRNQAFPLLTVLTPHPGEAARLLNSTSTKVQDDRIASIRALVELTRSIVILKGQHTLIASPAHTPLQCLQGNAGMATGGMGDVLTGSIAALAAQGIRHELDLWEASCLAVELHASAADALVNQGVGPIGLTPTELILEMRSVLNQNY
ncbi:NAD(P)H-hydrate dehydratase [Polynucleobacter paneuropaeus]|nr:NAD(P)H-hydrate dehydratase [Polynucleobacter paneuropaeus]